MKKVIIKRDDEGYDPRENDNFGKMICFHGRYRLGDESDLTIDQTKALERNKEVIWLPLYLYDHSGITMATKPFNCPWDSGKVGIIYITKKEARQLFNVSRITKKLVWDIKTILENEVKEYDSYLRGECYGYVIQDETGEEIDSCWGYIGEAGIEAIREEFSDNNLYSIVTEC